MRALTAAERRGVLLVAGLFLLGAAYDLWRAGRPEPAPLGGAPGARQALEPPPAVAPAPEAARGAPGWVPAATGPLDINRATASELEALDGIGPTLARRIVEHRRAHGSFRSVDELRAVRGIGPRLMERIRPRVAVRPAAG